METSEIRGGRAAKAHFRKQVHLGAGIHGAGGYLAQLEVAGLNAMDAVEAAFREAADDIFTLSQTQVPVDYPDGPHPGQLKRSGRIEVARDKDSVVVRISYGGEGKGDGGDDVPYGLWQHEEPHTYTTHVQHHDGGKWHYLSDPFAQVVPSLAMRVGQRVNATLRVYGK